MKAALFISLGLMLSHVAQAADRILTCTLSDFKDPARAVVATVNLNQIRVKSAITKASDGELKMGKLSYDFDVRVLREKKEYKLMINVVENNLVQDSVGTINCSYKDKLKGNWICVETIYSDEKRPLHDFHCQVL